MFVYMNGKHKIKSIPIINDYDIKKRLWFIFLPTERLLVKERFNIISMLLAYLSYFNASLSLLKNT